jgi:hypothetical protein
VGRGWEEEDVEIILVKAVVVDSPQPSHRPFVSHSINVCYKIFRTFNQRMA